MSGTTLENNSFFPRTLWLLAVNIGLLLIVVGTALPLFSINSAVVRCFFSAGALLVVAGRLFSPSTKGLSLRVRRMCRMEIWVGIIFCAGAFFMWYYPGRMDWLAFTLAGAVLQIYTSVALPRAIAKEKAGKTDIKQRKKK